ncbi:carboxypeptidase-like regulatory domain-containing protein [Ulvibacterium marinum]|uniref:carboxypeptidase-like regulatory domain-containing protein n=1 Tax=Ulvibacterium marinum TaxID=2419782 RepID=UPI0024943DBE|nr:carboxypeptidase-like regulatory domain-containing protein [Ulvibacterium marinum]
MGKVAFAFTLTFLLLGITYANAQVLSARIVDSTTSKPVPYVTVQLKKRGMITNEEGRFSFRLEESVQPSDSLFISCIGYESIGKPISEFKENTIYLRPKAIELKEVIVSNKNYTPREILDEVKKNLEKNYHLELTKKRLFLRESYQQNILKSDYVLKKSTIPAFNTNFLDSVNNTIPKNNSYYTEMLGDLYGGSKAKEQKLNIIKASELYDKSKTLDAETLEKKFNSIVKENIKTDSYFKIKSGLFGTKVDADELFETEVDSSDVQALNEHLKKTQENEQERKKFFAKYKRRTLGNLYKNLPVFKNSDYNVIFKPRRYRLTLEDYTYLGDDAVYVLRFEPEGSENFKGRLYINSDDFAIIRMDFENVETLRNFKLLGVSFNEYLAQGRMIFSKGKDGKYQLRYYEITKGNRIGFKRPLKIIEKNKNVRGRRKQNELSLKIDVAVSGKNRYELVVFDVDPVSETQYENIKENNSILPTYMPNYDPEFWSGYDIIEPNTAIKEFVSEAELDK